MSLGIVIKAPEGVILAAESRVTLNVQTPNESYQVNFDHATKLLSFTEPHTYVGAVTYGLAALGYRAAHSFTPEFEAQLPKERLNIRQFASRLSRFYMERWEEEKLPPKEQYNGPPMTFVVGGYNENEPYGRVYVCDIPKNPDPDERNADDFGFTLGGQIDTVTRLLSGYDSKLPETIIKAFDLSPAQIDVLTSVLAQFNMPTAIVAMPLQDCIDLALFLIRTTISAQSLSVRVRGCGGPIDIAVITRADRLKFVQRKEIKGERNINNDN